MTPRVAFITVNFGGYELSCRPFKKQTIPCDFIYFTDAKVTDPNGWTIDNTPWHETIETQKGLRNSFENNRHTNNITKFYKQKFQSIPRLKDYDMIIWIDGSIEISSETVAEECLSKIKEYPVISWKHNNTLDNEVRASRISKYISTYWNGQEQPYQDIDEQYDDYKADGCPNFDHVFITCFIAFDNKDPKVKEFLEHWWYQNLRYTNADQIGFVYSLYKTGIRALSLEAEDSCLKTDFYIKKPHDGAKKAGDVTIIDDPFTLLTGKYQPEGSYYLTIGENLNVIHHFRSFLKSDEEVYHLQDTTHLLGLVQKQKDKFISILCLINIRDPDALQTISSVVDKRTEVIFL